MAEKIDPSVPSLDYQANASAFDVIRTVMGGTEAMRSAGAKYLPQHPAEETGAYQSRTAQTVLNNRLESAVRTAAGKPLSEPVRLDNSSGAYDPYFDEFVQDVDLLGNALDVFARGLFEDTVEAGLAYILVDMPRASPGITLADEIAQNIRPYFIHYRAEDVLSCTISIEDGKPKVIDARFRENMIRMAGFSEIVVRRVRHWRSDGYDLWEMQVDDKGKEKDWAIVESGVNPLMEVTLVPLFTGRRKSKTGFNVKPPFLDLAWKNVEHWQSSSDQRNILKYARFPMLAGSGIKLPTKRGTADVSALPQVGPQALLITEDPQGKWYYVEPEGKAIEAGLKDLERLEREMDALAMKPHMKGTGEITAREVKSSDERENSAIKNMALNLKDAIERAFVFAQRYRNADIMRAPSVFVSTDFGDDFTNDEGLDALLKARVAGEISRETFWSECRRRGYLSVSFDPVAEANRLDAEGSGLTTDDPEDDDVDPIDPALAGGGAE